MTHSPATTAKPATPSKEPLSPFGAIFERITTLPGESQAEFAALLRRTTLRVVPCDEFEMALVREYVDITLDARRQRSIRQEVVRMARGRALSSILYEIVPRTSLTYPTISRLVRGYLTGEEKSIKRVRDLLDEYEYGEATLMARVYTDKAETLSPLDKQITSLERRRGRVLVELERHREGLGRLMAAAVPPEQETDAPPTWVPPMRSTPVASHDDERLGYRPWLHAKVEEPPNEPLPQESPIPSEEANESVDTGEVAPAEAQEGEARTTQEGEVKGAAEVEQEVQRLSTGRPLMDAAAPGQREAHYTSEEVKAVRIAGQAMSPSSADQEGESRHGH